MTSFKLGGAGISALLMAMSVQQVPATQGTFPHGYGVKSDGMGRGAGAAKGRYRRRIKPCWHGLGWHQRGRRYGAAASG